MGMGRYQWMIFFLCGFGYFLDLCWAQAFGLVGSAIQQELGIPSEFAHQHRPRRIFPLSMTDTSISPDSEIGQLSASFNAGLCIGAFMWGMLVDIIGRRWCFNLTCLFAAVFGCLFAAPSNWGAICFFAGMIGLGVGGNIPIDATITLEFLPKVSSLIQTPVGLRPKS